MASGWALTLVFDEIDTAVGGAVADAIGVRLARLSERVQVLAVTHAPQVAARAASHLLVSKAAARGGREVVTTVLPLDDARRREEIARMLAGATVTDEARASADRLILGAASGHGGCASVRDRARAPPVALSPSGHGRASHRPVS